MRGVKKKKKGARKKINKQKDLELLRGFFALVGLQEAKKEKDLPRLSIAH